MREMRARVLVFDDEPIIHEVFRSLCKRRGYEVLAFTDPEHCLLHTLNQCPCKGGARCADIIISDLNMPNVRGLDFLEGLLRKGCKCHALALMSGSWTDEDVARAERLGIKLFAKPFHIHELFAWLDNMVEALAADRRLQEWSAEGNVCHRTEDDPYRPESATFV